MGDYICDDDQRVTDQNCQHYLDVTKKDTAEKDESKTNSDHITKKDYRGGKRQKKAPPSKLSVIKKRIIRQLSPQCSSFATKTFTKTLQSPCQQYQTRVKIPVVWTTCDQIKTWDDGSHAVFTPTGSFLRDLNHGMEALNIIHESGHCGFVLRRNTQNNTLVVVPTFQKPCDYTSDVHSMIQTLAHAYQTTFSTKNILFALDVLCLINK